MLKFIGGVVVFIVAIAVIAGLSSGGADEPASQKNNNSSSSQSEDKSTSKKGGPMQVGDWEVQGKIHPEDDGLGDFAATFRVKNTGDTDRRPLFTVNALKGNKILGSMTCSGPNTPPGSIATVDCISTDAYKSGWSEVTIENAF